MLPYMVDERHAPDTLFFVCEEDFRLFARGSPNNCSITLNQKAEAAYAASSTAWRARNAAPVFPGSAEPVATELGAVSTWRERQQRRTTTHSSFFGPPVSGSDKWLEIERGMFVPTDGPAQRESLGGSEFLEDMVQICTKAHREDLGDLVWLSYDASPRQGYKTKVQQSATLLALSHSGAKKLKALVDADKKWWGQPRFDLRLIAYLQENGPDFGASYVYPCIGHYQANWSHSSLEGRDAWRDSYWIWGWVQEGTRRAHAYNGKHRSLCGWNGAKGSPDVKSELVLPSLDEDSRWYTRIGALETWDDVLLRRTARESARPQSKKKGSKPLLRNQSVWNLTAVEVDEGARGEAAKRRRWDPQRRPREIKGRHFAAANDPVATVLRKYAMSLSPGSCHSTCMYTNVM